MRCPKKSHTWKAENYLWYLYIYLYYIYTYSQHLFFSSNWSSFFWKAPWFSAHPGLRDPFPRYTWPRYLASANVWPGDISLKGTACLSGVIKAIAWSFRKVQTCTMCFFLMLFFSLAWMHIKIRSVSLGNDIWLFHEVPVLEDYGDTVQSVMWRLVGVCLY